ncbi:MAG: anhydro-N-acetylmuramic acid kinase [Proteobacteria bacterium]|jgi:anhydro-N-acetylmuramic acid kinase|nr:anhydro-N-acetylmuramic acid kinase [Pseudomonadota bacterium]MBT5065043.1 anhydro-N-acetylmuramic acid kinase [Pseudomonadota bacterium]MBT6192212.1 anhydro-N-acetylmuramic acid kinase [Pseudomonadota bacterium]MBT6465555.1 anhydro-N-acetylmuramic acid kinase [Pseudomonadota bacterium]MBT7246097.1 anhydro-N-acetylmuramic acid kinase [Pseudomonadota bacterium]
MNTLPKSTALVDGIYIGLMSGTSMDGVDVAVVNFFQEKIDFIHAETFEYPASIKDRLYKITSNKILHNLDDIGQLDADIGIFFGQCANRSIGKSNLNSSEVLAIGSHGQTIWHSPLGSAPYSWQIGNPSIITARTLISTVSDFRNLDMAFSGQGAPLAPAFHLAFLGESNRSRIVLNIGGIANISILDKESPTAIGYDTGPGNCLMDLWHQLHTGEQYDKGGASARAGEILPELLERFLEEDFFQKEGPKSTGRETFNLGYIKSAIKSLGNIENFSPEDIQATLLELTVVSITSNIHALKTHDIKDIYLCGGGSANIFLVEQLKKALGSCVVKSTADLGIDPDHVESCAFAWLAQQRISGRPVTLSTGGERKQLVLGALYQAP